MAKQRVLFICTHNSARSPIAEARLPRIGADRFEIESPGLEPGTLEPLVLNLMREVNIHLAGKTTQTVEVFKAGRRLDYGVALCAEEKAERCPVFPEIKKRLHWGVPERSKEERSREEQLAHVRSVRDLSRQRVEAWVAGNSLNEYSQTAS